MVLLGNIYPSVVSLWCLLFLSYLQHCSFEADKQPKIKGLKLTKFNYKHDEDIYDVRSDDQDAVDSSLWGGVVLKQAAKQISEHLRDLANDELGVTSLQVGLTI